MAESLENPNFFNSIPNEILIQMCESWPTGTLINMSETHSRVYEICQKEIKKRKEKFELDQKINLIVNRDFFKFKAESKNSEISYDYGYYVQNVDLGKLTDQTQSGFLNFISTIDTEALSKMFPWFLPEVKIEDNGFMYLESVVWVRSTNFKDTELLKTLIKRLYDANYKIVSADIILDKKKPKEGNLETEFQNMQI